jgi:hypothetical protein
MRSLPLVQIPAPHKETLFPGALAADVPPVVYFAEVERFTSWNRFCSRLLFVSTLGTLYVCDPSTGYVRHTMALADGGGLELEADAEMRDEDGRRALALRRPGDVNSTIVLVFDCSDGDRCGPFFAVVQHFQRGRDLRVKTTHDLLGVLAAQQTLPRRLSRTLQSSSGAASTGDVTDRSLDGVHATLRPLRSASGSRSTGRARPLLLATSDASPAASRGSGAATPNAAPVPAAVVAGDRMGIGPAMQRRMERLYRLHCPERLPGLEAAMAKYVGQEESLLEAMVAKYGPEPPPTPPNRPASPAASADEGPDPPVAQRSVNTAASSSSYAPGAPHREESAPIALLRAQCDAVLLECTAVEARAAAVRATTDRNLRSGETMRRQEALCSLVLAACETQQQNRRAADEAALRTVIERADAAAKQRLLDMLDV